MIMIDRRVGSCDLIDLLPKELCTIDSLQFGDIAFLGQGPGGIPVKVGIELKALGDCLSSIRSGRFAGTQLPGLLQWYDKVYVVIEGQYRPGADGILEGFMYGKWRPAPFTNGKGNYNSRGTQPWLYSELEGWINTITNVAGVVVKRSGSRKETAALVLNLYRWWTEKTFEQHRSHVGFDESQKPTLYKPSFIRRVAAEFPGIGWEKSSEVALKFGTLWNLVQADEKIWASITGIGKTLAKRAFELIRNGEEKKQ